MLNLFYFLINPNNTVVSLLVVLIILTSFVFIIPNGQAPASLAGGARENNVYYSITKTYCLFVTMVPLI
jgi:hypothetical protein